MSPLEKKKPKWRKQNKDRRKLAAVSTREWSDGEAEAWDDDWDEEESEWSVPPGWLTTIAGLILLPIALVSVWTLLVGFHGVSSAEGFVGSAPIWFFGIGFFLWIFMFWGLPRPVTLYVFGHEFTHAIFALLCGGRLEEFEVGRSGGHIVTDKNNLVIALSPYFVPIFTIFIFLCRGVAGIFLDVGAYHEGVWFWGLAGFSWSWVFYILVGLTWAFHLTFTVWMIGKDQPDLQLNGTFFSLVVILIGNTVLLSFMLIAAEPQLTLVNYFELWGDKFSDLFSLALQKVRIYPNSAI